MNENRTTSPPAGGDRDGRERWLAAICYLGPLVFWPLLAERRRSRWLAFHCRQGFALFAAEVAAWLLLIVLDTTVGRIPILGLIVSLVLHLAAGLLFLVLAVVGFFKTLGGESWRIPGLEELAERIPVESHDAPGDSASP